MELTEAEMRQELQDLQQANGNGQCVDCMVDSPQWSSPKNGVYICISCAGVHRSLGVHISFVRSITMDRPKPVELELLKLGGNNRWKEFFNAHPDNKLEKRTFDECTISERYDSEAGKEWRAQLASKAGQDPAPAASSQKQTPVQNLQGLRSQGEGSTDHGRFARNGFSSAASRSDSPAIGTSSVLGGGRKSEEQMPTLPNAQDFSNDPVSAISMGLGWLGATVTKNAKVGMETIASSDIGSVAQQAAAQINQGIQTGTRSATDALTRFVDGDDDTSQTRGVDGERGAKQRDDIWSERFASFNRTGQSLWDSIGTSSANFATMITGGNDDLRSHSQARRADENSDLAYGSHPDFLASHDELPGAKVPVGSSKKSTSAPNTKATSAGDEFWDEFGLETEAKPRRAAGSKKD